MINSTMNKEDSASRTRRLARERQRKFRERRLQKALPGYHEKPKNAEDSKTCVKAKQRLEKKRRSFQGMSPQFLMESSKNHTKPAENEDRDARIRRLARERQRKWRERQSPGTMEELRQKYAKRHSRTQSPVIVISSNDENDNLSDSLKQESSSSSSDDENSDIDLPNKFLVVELREGEHNTTQNHKK